MQITQKEEMPLEEQPSALIRYLSKMKGSGRSPLKVNGKDALTGLIGGFLTILSLVWLTDVTNATWLMAPFGASCVLVFGVWNAPLSQPRNVIGGHFLSGLIGLTMYHLFGNQPWSIALAVGLAIMVMLVTKTTHPPAGADPIVVMLGGYGWSYLVAPVLIGAVLIVALGLIINNLRSARQYPTFWF